ncbi:MAG: hypothetical protein LBL95_04475, partial [Deltaproteobacteria bacterium]|nr:hypothetical protein [Deltaproteobacteria bacterium]
MDTIFKAPMGHATVGAFVLPHPNMVEFDHVVIDEYDASVIKVIQDPGLSKIADLLEDTRSVMSDFYGKIKAADKYL